MDASHTGACLSKKQYFLCECCERFTNIQQREFGKSLLLKSNIAANLATFRNNKIKLNIPTMDSDARAIKTSFSMVDFAMLKFSSYLSGTAFNNGFFHKDYASSQVLGFEGPLSCCLDIKILTNIIFWAGDRFLFVLGRNSSVVGSYYPNILHKTFWVKHFTCARFFSNFESLPILLLERRTCYRDLKPST